MVAKECSLAIDVGRAGASFSSFLRSPRSEPAAEFSSESERRGSASWTIARLAVDKLGGAELKKILIERRR